MKERVTVVLYCPIIDRLNGEGSDHFARSISASSSTSHHAKLETAGAKLPPSFSSETVESQIITLNAGESVSVLQKSVLERSRRKVEVQVVDELIGFEVHLSNADGPWVVGSDLVTEVLRDGDYIYIVPSQNEAAEPPLYNERLLPDLKTSLLCEMLEVDSDNLRWIMNALIKRRGSELDWEELEKDKMGKSLGFLSNALYSSCNPPREERRESYDVLEVDEPVSQKAVGLPTHSRSNNKVFAESDLVEALRDEETEMLDNPEYSIENFNEVEVVIQRRDESRHGRPCHSLPTVAFDRAMYSVVEGTPYVEIIVQRTGDLTPEVSIDYKTADASAISGKKYKSAAGVLTFLPGERQLRFHVDIMDNDSFEPMLEFNVILENPRNCRLRDHAKKSRVRIIDDDFFPSNRVRQIVAGGRIRAASVTLFWEYLKSNFADPIIKRGTIKAILAEVFENIRFLATLIITVFLVDFVLSEKVDKHTAPHLLLLCSASYLSLFLCSHILKYRKCFWKIGGTSRKNLLRNLMRKYLTFNSRSLSAITDTDILLLIARDVPRLVDDGYLAFLEMIDHILSIFALLFYQLVMPHVYSACGLGKPVTIQSVFMSLVPIVVYPIFMAAYLKCRAQKSRRTLYAEEDAQNELFQSADEILHSKQLISAYRIKPQTIDNWEAKAVGWTKAMVQSASVHCNNTFFAPWLTTIIIALWIVVGGPLVKESQASDGESGISLGDFLVTWRIFLTAGNAWAAMYKVLLTMQEAVPSAENVTVMMNLATDARDFMVTFDRQAELQERETTRILEEGKLKTESVRDYADKHQIKMVNFEYRAVANGQVCATMKIHRNLHQGLLYLVIGGKGSGKNTLLKLIGGDIFSSKAVVPPLEQKIQARLEEFFHNESPGQSTSTKTPSLSEPKKSEDEIIDGEFVMPSHLHVLSVYSEPLFFRGTLFDNLIMGVPAEKLQNIGDVEDRVLGICRNLGLPDFILELISERQGYACSTFALSHQVLLSLSRAFIANPEVLVLHKPMVNLTKSSKKCVMRMLREFVDQRGVAQDQNAFWLRQPRTCFMTGDVVDGCNMADAIFEVHVEPTPIATHRSFRRRQPEDVEGNGLKTLKAKKLYRSCTSSSLRDAGLTKI